MEGFFVFTNYLTHSRDMLQYNYLAVKSVLLSMFLTVLFCVCPNVLANALWMGLFVMSAVVRQGVKNTGFTCGQL